MQRQNEIAVGAGQQAGQHFHDGDASAERGIDRAEFEADVSAANNQQAPGDVFEIERAGGIHQARRIEFEGRNNSRARTGGDNDAIEGQRFFRVVRFCDAQGCRIFKGGPALNVFHFALLGEYAEAAGEFLYNTFFPGSQPAEVNFGFGKFDAPVFGLVRFFDQLGDVE